jgi:LacI family transcriptional regulator
MAAVSLGVQAPHVAGVLAGINAVAVARGWVLHMYDPGQFLRPAMIDHKPDLMVAVMTGDLPEELLNGSSGVPLVAAGLDLSDRGVVSVDVDDEAAGELAGQHLASRGLRTLAAFGFWQHGWALRRVVGFRRAAMNAGIPCVVSGWPDVTTDPPIGDAGLSKPIEIRAWLLSLPKPTGMMICCDAWAQLITNQARLAGIRVPEDLALVGIDNNPQVCELMHPPLSSVDIPWRRIGYDAAQLGERLLRRESIDVRRIALPPAGVVARRSSDVLAVDDPDVAAALAFIHARADRPVTVAQILRHVPVYQHRLERKFKQLVGRRMQQEIRRVHVELAKRLLTATDLPMPDVAVKSGFANASKLSVAFRTETGQTPSDFRRRFRLAPL